MSVPAFPEPSDALKGMDLRDYFAAYALLVVSKLMLKDPTATRLAQRERGIDATQALATGAYEIADAMLKAREELR